MERSLKLDIGCGSSCLPGYEPVDVAVNGREAYPLAYPDECAEAIHASHILEHFSHRDTLNVLKDWVRVLKPGGELRLSVPDFDVLIANYEVGNEANVEGILMGGQTNDYDCHLAIFNETKLRTLMEQAGLEYVCKWKPTLQTTAALPQCLNLEGTKLEGAQPAKTPDTFRVAACISVPRLGFNDNWQCIFLALGKLGIPLRRHTGAFWGQCLERAMVETLAEPEKPDAILTIDYDTIFTTADVERLIELMIENPQADAIAGLQASRTKGTPLLTMHDEAGKARMEIRRDEFDVDLVPVATAHFGLTLIRRKVLETLPHPWFHSQPNPATGQWDDERVDDDIYFWRQMAEYNLQPYVAPRVAVGHAELMIRWPDQNLAPLYQHSSEYWEKGKPEESWQ